MYAQFIICGNDVRRLPKCSRMNTYNLGVIASNEPVEYATDVPVAWRRKSDEIAQEKEISVEDSKTI